MATTIRRRAVPDPGNGASRGTSQRLTATDDHPDGKALPAF
jgi:hypothetical protein